MDKQNCKTIIFDFDGVIIDTENYRYQKIKNILEDYGITLQEDNQKDMVGMKTTHYLRQAFTLLNEEQIEDIKKKWFEDKEEMRMPIIKGYKEFLREAKKNYKVAICTGSYSTTVKTILAHNKVEEKEFATIVGGEMYHSSKPDPECYELTLKRVDIEASEAIVIEDSQAGVKAGKAAGCKVWGLGTYHTEEELKTAGADEYYEDYEEMLMRLKELQK